MDEANDNPVLRCGLCNKPFDKESTLKRHGYYCRSRKVGSKPRARSCYHCASRRARCDNTRPECSRCRTKGVQCQYPMKITRIRDAPITHSPYASVEVASSLVAGLATSEDIEAGRTDVDALSNSAFTMLDPEFETFGGGFLGWEDPEISFPEFMNPQNTDKTIRPLSPPSSTFLPQSAAWTNETLQLQQAITSRNVSIPRSPTYHTRSLILRSKTKTGATQRIANMILHTLKSYPLMMLRHNTLPPFIHPGLVSSNAEDDQMEPLTNCISLVHMISNGQGSRKLFWKNVGRECEYLIAEHINMNKWELLAAMQALSIYILIRLDEGETEHNDFDCLLLTAVAKIAIQITRINNSLNEKTALCKNYGHEMTWKDWVYEESRRRLSVVYRVVNMLVYFEAAAMCTLQTDLILAPLPAKKELWEASNERMWKTETSRNPGSHDAFALAANGELVKLSENQPYCGDSVLLYNSIDVETPERTNGHWEEWCSGMDGFGGLVMLAASLIV